MELTSRQLEFVAKLIDLYAEVEDNIHYSQVADRLGVSRSTAYDMLRLLERKGFARAHYVLEEPGGPGRSTVLFSPTERARETFARLREQAGPAAKWELIKARIISAVLAGDVADKESVTQVLTALARDDRALSLCTRVVTSALLTCAEHWPPAGATWDLLAAALGSDSALVLLPGLAVVSLEDAHERRQTIVRWSDYQQALLALTPEQRDDLLRLAREMAGHMRPPSDPPALLPPGASGPVADDRSD